MEIDQNNSNRSSKKELEDTIKLGILGVVLVSLFLSAFLVTKTVVAIIEAGDKLPYQNTITVIGEGEAFAVPDTASFTFSVIENDKTVADAQSKATDKMNKAIEFLKNSGVEEKDIRTTLYNFYPKYEYQRSNCPEGMFDCPVGRSILIGYEVNQNIEVKVRNTDSSGDILAGIGNLAVSDVSGLNFIVDDEEAVMAEARAKAITVAKEKAEQLARDLDVKLKKVVSFSEDSGDYYPKAYESSAIGLGGGENTVAPELPLGENQINSRVYITYEIK